MEKKIIIDILPDGSVKMEGENFSGVQCEKAMKKYEEALGKVTEKKLKPEYYNNNQSQKAFQ